MPELHADLPHAVCIVMHVAASARTQLPGILDRRCPLPHVGLSRGPKENGVRPAVDDALRIRDAAEPMGIDE